MKKSLQIRDTPEELYTTISDAAEREGRSLSQQALYLLTKAANITVNAKQRRKDVLAKFEPFKVSSSFNCVEVLAKDRAR